MASVKGKQPEVIRAKSRFLTSCWGGRLDRDAKLRAPRILLQSSTDLSYGFCIALKNVPRPVKPRSLRRASKASPGAPTRLGASGTPLFLQWSAGALLVRLQSRQQVIFATLLAKPRHARGISAQLAMWTRPAPCDVTFTSRWRQRSERDEPQTYSADASVDHTSITPKRATTSLAASGDPTNVASLSGNHY